MSRTAPIGFRLVHELEGLITGIAADEVIHPRETARLRRWVDEARSRFAHVEPFSSLLHHVDAALHDGVLTLEECQNLKSVASRLTTVNPHFNAQRTGLQVLFGLLNGIVADGHIRPAELATLSEWAVEWRHLAGLWPYDECATIVRSMVARHDHAEEVRYLLELAGRFSIQGHMNEHDLRLVQGAGVKES